MPPAAPGDEAIPTPGSGPIVLVHPPQALPCEPPPGLPVLAHHLSAAGLAVQLVDSNLGVLERLFTPPSLTSTADALAAAGGSRASVTSALRCARHVPTALASLRREPLYRQPARYRAAVDDLMEGCRAISRARGVRLTPSDLLIPQLSPLSARNLLEACREPSRCGLGPELAAEAQRILDLSPGLVGISATYLSQALPAAALVGLLRQGGYRGPLALGGGVVTSWLAHLTPQSEIFQIWDALVAGPGEDALLSLYRTGGKAVAPGLLAPNLGVWNPPRAGAPATTNARPRLDGLPWDRYLAPGPILPLATCRGCYWRRCTYCPETAQDPQAFRPSRASEIAEHLLRARDEHGIRRAHITDDAIPPGTLRRLARLLRDQGISWYGFVRPEPALMDPGLAGDLARGGCAMLQLGIESGSQSVLDRLGKGTRAEHAAPILANLTSAGIRTYVYLLFGVPGETQSDREATMDWADRSSDTITFFNLALMNVPRQAAPDLASGGERELSLYAGMEPGDPLDRRSARRALTAIRSIPALRPILRRSPPGFGSNHAAWVALEDEEVARSDLGQD